MYSFRALCTVGLLLLSCIALPCLAEDVSAALVSDTSAATRLADSLRTVHANQVVVTGTRNTVRLMDSPVRVEVIDKERIKTTAMVSLGDLLKEQTGFLLQGNVRTGVQMNGLGPDYTLILVDGQPVIGRVAGVIDMSRVSVGNIERVEVVKGPMSSMYGSEALAGVINIITSRPPEGLSGKAFTQYVSRGPAELRVEAGYATDSLELSGFVNYKHAAAFSLFRDTLEIPYSGFQDGTMQVKGLLRLNKFWKLKSWVRLFGTKTEGTFIESVFGQVAKNQGSVVQYDASGTFGTEWTQDRSHLQVNAYASSYQERYNFDVSQGAAGKIDDMTRRIARLYGQYDYVVGASNRAMFGGEFLYDDIFGTRYEDSTHHGTQFYRTYVAFGQWEGLPADWISYVLSARYDGNNVYGSAVSPRFSVLWKPIEHWRFSGSVGSGFKAPDFRQLFVVFSNRLPGAGYDLIGAARLGNTLKPERSVSYDISMRYEDGLRELSNNVAVLYSADIRLFRNDLRNLIEYYLYGVLDNRNIYSYRNLSRVTTQGLEFNMQVAFAFSDLGTITLSGGYQFLDAFDVEVLDAIKNGTAGTITEPLTLANYHGLWNRSKNSGTLRLQYDTHDHRWSANVRAQFVGRYGDESLDKNGIVISNPPRKVLDRDDEFVDGYVVCNCAVTHNVTVVGQPMMIGVGANNMFDVVKPTLIPGLVGRQFFVQLSTTF